MDKMGFLFYGLLTVVSSPDATPGSLLDVLYWSRQLQEGENLRQLAATIKKGTGVADAFSIF
jgi:hypothetical protein